MQTGIWMAYSDAMHFSDKLSYKTLCILSYASKDIIHAKFIYLQKFSEKETKTGLV
jgi:hypothetical protein